MCAECEQMDPIEYSRRLTPKSSYSHYPMEFLSDPQNFAKVQVTLEGVKYDTLVGTGMSGTLVVPRLAEYLGKDWAIVRKRQEHSHRERMIEGTRFGERWIFVDDFQQYGGTERRVLKEVDTHLDYQRITSTYVGSFFYNKFEWTNKEEIHAETWEEQVQGDLDKLPMLEDLTINMDDLYNGKYDRDPDN